jgi:hypothetical protein
LSDRISGRAHCPPDRLGLCVALIRDWTLYAHGLTFTGGRALWITTAGIKTPVGAAAPTGAYIEPWEVSRCRLRIPHTYRGKDTARHLAVTQDLDVAGLL